MNIFYACDNEYPAAMSLDTLLANFASSGTKVYKDDIFNDLNGRGWYEGLHENGRYIILNMDKLRLMIQPCAS